MARKNEAHDVVIESLTEALLLLMETKPLSDISVSELCGQAGVSRVSFYRNYRSTRDILVRRLTQCTDDWWNEYSKRGGEESYDTFWAELLGQYRNNERLIKLLYKSNASDALKEQIFSCCGPCAEHCDMEAYTRSALAGMIYGLVDEWIRRGMQDLPKGFSLHNISAAMHG